MMTPFSGKKGRPSTEMAITIDHQGRIYLSKALQRELNCEGKGIKLYLGYDAETKRIGLAKPEEVQLPQHRPIRFDKHRGYASVRSFLHYFRIPYNHTSRYVLIAKENGWYTFEQAETQPIQQEA